MGRKVLRPNYDNLAEVIDETFQPAFVEAETRKPTSGKGLAFGVEVAIAYGGQIKEASRASDVLYRFVNRTPKLRDNSDCAIWKAVGSVNWKNYKLDAFDNGLPRGKVRVIVNVSGPFVHVMFKSQSKQALADDETLKREVQLALEEVGRKLRSYLLKKESQACASQGGCPGSRAAKWDKNDNADAEVSNADLSSQLRNWPVQLNLVSPMAPYLQNAALLIAADCVGFAYSNFHQDLLSAKVLLVGCPKLDDAEFYTQKLTKIFKNNDIKSITCVHMEVPCCFGLINIVKSALSSSGKNISFSEVTVSIKGEILK